MTHLQVPAFVMPLVLKSLDKETSFAACQEGHGQNSLLAANVDLGVVGPSTRLQMFSLSNG